MIKTYGTVRCKDCDKDITEEVQYYEEGEVRCGDCNEEIK